ncbi:MAG: peptidase M10 [Bacteroidetes bacterium 43-16]|nr:MAG: peptidase M10 [Bacteroidetes bacterium 43-16]
MGTVELLNEQEALLKADIIIYGGAADEALSKQMAAEIETMWTEVQGKIRLGSHLYTLSFSIQGFYVPDLSAETIFHNKDPRKNFFRVESFVNGNISFVDAINCNTGFFKLDNLYPGSTTAAHEFGHTIGLDHPQHLDLRGKGIPGIMYPRGTIVDPQYQYSDTAPAGQPGGTLHPQFRKVWKEEVARLQVNDQYRLEKGWVIGDFTNVWHEPHDMFA